MNTLVSVHEIHFSANDVVKANHVFEATDGEKQFLVERNAVRGFVKDQDDKLPVAKRQAALPASKAAESDLSKLKKEELLALAEKEGVTLKGDEKVDELRQAIEAHRLGGESSVI